MTANHTPGPWIPAERSYPKRTEILVQADGNDVATVHGETLDEARIDAVLIAAAPELLEALKAAAAFWRMRKAELDYLSPEAQEVLDLAEAAIAKAQGL